MKIFSFFSGKPTLTRATSSPEIALFSTSARLICAEPTLTTGEAFTFDRGNTPIYTDTYTDTSKYVATVTPGQVEFEIKNIAVGDEGNYICNANFGDSDPLLQKVEGELLKKSFTNVLFMSSMCSLNKPHNASKHT